MNQIEAMGKLFGALKNRHDLPEKPDAALLAAKLLLKLDECSALTGLSRAVLRSAIDAGELKAQTIGRAWRVKRSNLDKWIEGL